MGQGPSCNGAAAGAVHAAQPHRSGEGLSLSWLRVHLMDRVRHWPASDRRLHTLACQCMRPCVGTDCHAAALRCPRRLGAARRQQQQLQRGASTATARLRRLTTGQCWQRFCKGWGPGPMRSPTAVMARSELSIDWGWRDGMALASSLAQSISSARSRLRADSSSRRPCPIAPQPFSVSIYPDPFFLPPPGLSMAVCPVAALL